MQKLLKNTLKLSLDGDRKLGAMERQLQSWLGVFSHANQQALSRNLKNSYKLPGFAGFF